MLSTPRIPIRVVWPLVLAFTIVPVAPLAAQDVPESSPQAVMAFARGMEHYTAGRSAEAVPLFLEAHEHDDEFFVALFLGGLAASNAQQGAVRDSVWTIVEANKHRLSDYYRFRYESQQARRTGDLAGAIAISRLAADIAPMSKGAYNLAWQLNRVGHYEEARDILLALDRDSEPMRNWISFYSQLARAHHELGEHERGLAIAKLQEQRFPEAWSPLFWQARALGALGNVDGIERLVARAETRDPVGQNSPATLLVTAATELEAHGHTEPGRALMARAEAWFADQPEGAVSVALRNWWAYALRQLGRLDDAVRVTESLLADAPDNPWFHTQRALVAAERGNERRARQERDWLESQAESRPINPSFLGHLAAAADRHEEAIRYFENAVQRGWFYDIWWHTDPALSELRQMEAFKEFLAPNG